MREQFWIWPSFFSKSDIKNINKIIKRKPFKGHDQAANTTKTSTVDFCSYGFLKKYLCDISERINQINANKFGYFIYPFNDYDSVSVNTYSHKNTGEYDWHVDEESHCIHDIKFTILINISEQKYEGGEFSLFRIGEQKIKDLSKPGTVLMFKSITPHRVYPVTKGTRKTIAMFVKGPRFI